MLSSRARYATRALLDLTQHGSTQPVPLHETAERQDIPLKFLEQVMLSLRRHGFVRSRKGPGGGYLLARAPAEITLGAVVRAMDGSIAPMSCVSVSEYRECGCPDPETCGLRAAWQEARDALAAVLDGTTFADVRDRSERLRAHHDQVINYVI